MVCGQSAALARRRALPTHLVVPPSCTAAGSVRAVVKRFLLALRSRGSEEPALLRWCPRCPPLPSQTCGPCSAVGWVMSSQPGFAPSLPLDLAGTCTSAPGKHRAMAQRGTAPPAPPCRPCCETRAIRGKANGEGKQCWLGEKSVEVAGRGVIFKLLTEYGVVSCAF